MVAIFYLFFSFCFSIYIPTIPIDIDNDNKGQGNLLGYKIYLNKERNESESSLEDENFWDLAVADVYNNSNKDQQRVAAPRTKSNKSIDI